MDVTLVVDALGPQLSGIGRYAWELCTRVPLEPRVEEVRFFVNGRFVKDVDALLEGRVVHAHARLPHWVRKPVIRRRLQGSIVHGPNYFIPPEAETGIITVHDLSVFRYPETHPAERVSAFGSQFESSLRRAAHIITDTETVRREVIADFGVPEARVTAIPLGVGREYRPRTAAELGPLLAPLQLTPGGYALCVSTLEPRKRIGELLYAWRGLPVELRNSTPLVLAGAQGWLNDSLHDEIGEGIAEGWLMHLGFVSEPVLLALYAGASLFLYPSIYEGFGLPPIEAMASGVPVLVANRSCLPEVCGDAAGYVDPDDVEAFRKKIVGALTDNKWRIKARAKGLERAAAFSWDKCAARTAALYARFAPRQ